MPMLAAATSSSRSAIHARPEARVAQAEVHEQHEHHQRERDQYHGRRSSDVNRSDERQVDLVHRRDALRAVGQLVVAEA